MSYELLLKRGRGRARIGDASPEHRPMEGQGVSSLNAGQGGQSKGGVLREIGASTCSWFNYAMLL